MTRIQRMKYKIKDLMLALSDVDIGTILSVIFFIALIIFVVVERFSELNVKKEDPIVNLQMIEVNNQLYELNNSNSDYKIFAPMVEVDSIKLNENTFSVVLYENSVLLFRDDIWYQYDLIE